MPCPPNYTPQEDNNTQYHDPDTNANTKVTNGYFKLTLKGTLPNIYQHLVCF